MFVFKEDFVNRVIFFVAISIFAASMISQFMLEKQPCQLCLIDRYLFLSLGILALLAKWRKMLLPIGALITLAFTFYHLGVENHWWLGTSGCVSELPSLNSTPMDSKTPACDSVNWIVLGISSTLWGVLFASFIFWFSSTSYLINFYLRRSEEMHSSHCHKIISSMLISASK